MTENERILRTVKNAMSGLLPVHKVENIAPKVAESLIANNVTEVVRCKDCERVYKYKDRYFCLNDNSEMNAEDFCSYGEREER